ncbi:integrase catalytic domain-containing protein [Trichonephila clavata]|uniref:Integrase catalytic domain-containing protein n=1 Tax=Trichonephila clavata TaxID=2740835 RepID=A0A8X6LMF8_TRICU|nr:integrase catalytic domain-containing protein [Trichonephila clavata]
MVRSVKVALRKTLGKSLLNTEQLLTVLTEIEGMINSRPITYVDSETEEPIPLTPAHFIIGKRITSLPPRIPGHCGVTGNEYFSSSKEESFHSTDNNESCPFYQCQVYY